MTEELIRLSCRTFGLTSSTQYYLKGSTFKVLPSRFYLKGSTFFIDSGPATDVVGHVILLLSSEIHSRTRGRFLFLSTDLLDHVNVSYMFLYYNTEYTWEVSCSFLLIH
jgi:hypothetical protein